MHVLKPQEGTELCYMLPCAGTMKSLHISTKTHSDSTCEIWSRHSRRDRKDKPPEAKDKMQRMFIFQRSRDSSWDHEKYRNG